VSEHAETLEQAMDRISLAQALADVEAANARVLVLTRRMLELEDALNTARRELRMLGNPQRTKAFSAYRRLADARVRRKRIQ